MELQANIQHKLPIILSIQAKRKLKQNLCNNPENSKLMSTMHKHCYDMKAQTDNAEHINDNRLVFCFYGSRIQTTKITMLWKKSLHFEIWRTRSYALYKRSCYSIVKREQSPNSILKRQNSKLQVSFALWLAFMWHILD